MQESIALNKAMSKKQSDDLKKILNYDNKNGVSIYQPIIAGFFMNSPDIDISTCFFCNIDYINSFNTVGDYFDGLDFAKRAGRSELLKIANVGPAVADKIMAERAAIGSINELSVSDKIKASLAKIEIRNRKNQFTLDHVLDKGTHPLAALSLYNFVPSCYNCNSKMKGSIPLLNGDASVSPTSKNFQLAETVHFKLFFRSDTNGNFSDEIKSTNDFILNIEIDAMASRYEGYIELFGLKSRYVFHKREALNLLAKRKRYSDSQIREIARLVGVAEQQVRKDIFGEDIFEKSALIRSFTKLKRDIAKQIGISE